MELGWKRLLPRRPARTADAPAQLAPVPPVIVPPGAPRPADTGRPPVNEPVAPTLSTVAVVGPATPRATAAETTDKSHIAVTTPW
jgi:hypothetical protein